MTYGQYDEYYRIIEDGDTISFEFTEGELESFNNETTLILNHNIKSRKRFIKEYTVGEIALSNSDTIYWVGLAKFYDQYFIGLLARKKLIRKSKYELYNYEYRRIDYSEVTHISTAGRNRFFWPRFVLGFTALTGGFGFAIGSIAGNPALIPVGLAVSVLGYFIVSPLMTKDYYLEDWSHEVLTNKSK
ncbi:MAG: hypothetical protein AAGC88_00380 [Bacteroidota bacterium]